MKKKTLKHKLFNQYNIVLRNSSTYIEKFSLKLTPFNFMALISLFITFIIGFAFLAIRFTPLKYYVVDTVYTSSGYSVNQKTKILALTKTVDSLENVLKKNTTYTKNIQTILSGKIIPSDIKTKDLKQEILYDIKDEDFIPSKEDLELRKKVSKEERFNLKNNQKNNATISNLLFPPTNGLISSKFDLKENHKAIDIAAQKDSPIKSIADGVVIFSGWTSLYGNVIIVSHANNFLSVYMHNSVNYKEQGDFVKTAEAIGAVGDTGELSEGPHLHFELWLNGYQVDPEKYINF